MRFSASLAIGALAAFGDVEEMSPTEGERDRSSVGSTDNGLVRGLTVALHDARIMIEQA
jgi:hypothetical protein